MSVSKQPVVWYINWTEYEAGWGQRNDGCSIHTSLGAAQEFKRHVESCGTYEDFSRGTEPRLIIATPEMIKCLGKQQSAWLHSKQWL